MENQMTKNFFSAWSLLFSGQRKTYERDLLSYAKTEYRNDWQHAYQHMIENDGRGPCTTTYGKWKEVK
jgi:hypothetical protein